MGYVRRFKTCNLPLFSAAPLELPNYRPARYTAASEVHAMSHAYTSELIKSRQAAHQLR